ncbi:hypothetical protein BB561_005668 [Smittium simulii]|uniref:Inorganic pyrophosphatase n=1 Tax=Smittium simulii TaxID=133385 RepID=A0A2T9Y976_9FUNG|nr:hypothetical protein BB561_005668 [Smittium simulii]
MPYSTRSVSKPDTHEYKVYLENEGKIVSFFHDIPLYANAEKKIYNMIVEIPRWTNAKLEIKTDVKYNYIAQDTKKGALRYVSNSFPHHGYIWNYGALPQTWEDPDVIDQSTGCNGDNDPIDVCEIGEKVGYVGQIKQVKVVGLVALIDEGETDWKLIAIDVTDPLANMINDIEDVEVHYPGLLKATVEWFRIYKIPDGKGENKFAFNAQPRGKDFAAQIIEETHHYWKKLVFSQSNNHQINTSNTTVESSPGFISNEDQDVIATSSPTSEPSINQALYKWHFIKPSKY